MCVYIHDFIDYGATVIGLLLIVCGFLAYPILGFPIDRKLPKRDRIGTDFWFGPISTFFHRPAGYAAKIIVMPPKRKEKMKQKRGDNAWVRAELHDYGDFDFQKETNLFQKMFAYLLFIDVVAMGAIFPFFFIFALSSAELTRISCQARRIKHWVFSLMSFLMQSAGVTRPVSPETAIVRQAGNDPATAPATSRERGRSHLRVQLPLAEASATRGYYKYDPTATTPDPTA